MPAFSNMITAALMAPLAAVLGALSLASLQRALEWVTAIAKNPQK